MTITRPWADLSHPREMVRHFTPNWFTATMGTGILALAAFPLSVPGLPELAKVLWWFNMALFALCSGLYAARWIFFYDKCAPYPRSSRHVHVSAGDSDGPDYHRQRTWPYRAGYRLGRWVPARSAC
jgi:hypothetical protein